MMLILCFMVLLSSCVSQELMPFGPHWMIADPILNILERDNVYYLNQDPQRTRTMQVRRFYGEENPFSEIFRIMNTMLKESEAIFNQTLLRINNVSEFEQRMDMKCEPTITEGKWYRMRSIHCVSNSNSTTPLQELVTSAPTAIPTPMLKVAVQERSTTIPVLTIILSIVVICLFCALFAYSYVLIKQKRRRDNRIIVSGSNSLPNYGTFRNFTVC